MARDSVTLDALLALPPEAVVKRVETYMFRQYGAILRTDLETGPMFDLALRLLPAPPAPTGPDFRAKASRALLTLADLLDLRIDDFADGALMAV